MAMTAVSPTPNRMADPPITWRCQARVRNRGSMSATDQVSSHPASAKSAGLRSDTGPVNGPPRMASAAMCTTIVASRTVPTIQRMRGHFMAPSPRVARNLG